MKSNHPADPSGHPTTRGRVGTRAAAATAAAAAIAALLVTSQPTVAKPAARTAAAPLTFLVKPTSEVSTDPSFPKVGDVLVTTDDNLRGGRRIGTDRTGCFVVDSAGTLQCQTTVGLPGGTLEIAYLDTVTGTHFTSAITGGTGRYAAARGYASLRQISSTSFKATAYIR